MGYSKYKLTTINIYTPLKELLILHTYLPIAAISPQWPLSSVPKVAFLERFDCMIFQRLTNCLKNFAFSHPLQSPVQVDYVKQNRFSSNAGYDFLFLNSILNSLYALI